MSYTRPHEDRLGIGGAVGEFLRHTGSGTAEWAAPSAGSNAVSYGSNSSTIGEISLAGGSNAVARADHYHAGIGTIISNTSNQLQRGTLRIVMGNNMSWGLTDSDGDGEFDTVTFHSTGGGAGGGGSSLTVQESDGSPSGTISTLVFPNDTVTINGSTATIREVPQGYIGARAYSSSDFNLSNNTITPVTFNAEDFDTDGFHSTSSNSERMTIPAGLGGPYLIFANVEWETNDTDGDRLLYIQHTRGATNTIIAWGRQPPGSTGLTGAGEHGIPVSTVFLMEPGDYVQCLAFQNSGSTVALNTRDRAFHFGVFKLDSGRVGAGVGARVYNTGSQTITTATWTALTLNSERFDTDAFHSTSANTERFTIPSGLGGKYLINANIGFAANTTGQRGVRLRLNDATTLAQDLRETMSDGALGTRMAISCVYELVATDYIEVEVWQDSGGDLSSEVAANATPEFSIMRLDSGSRTASQTYTPTWSSTGTAPAIGNGTITGTYSLLADGLVVVHINMTLGSTSTVGTGNYRWSLPAIGSFANLTTGGSAHYRDNSSTERAGGVVNVEATNLLCVRGAGAINENEWSATFPVNPPATSDSYHIMAFLRYT